MTALLEAVGTVAGDGIDATPSAMTVARPRAAVDPESRAWLEDLRSDGPRSEAAEAALHDLLLRAARFEIGRRRRTLSHLRGGDFDDLAHQAAADAMVAVLAKLDTFRGESRFTTWAYKFALLEAAVKLRRRAWQGREIPIEPEHWSVIASENRSPTEAVESGELVGAVKEAIASELSAHQRDVLLAVTLNGVPIDVLAERLNTTRGALYKTIHDARRKLRDRLAAENLLADDPEPGRRT